MKFLPCRAKAPLHRYLFFFKTPSGGGDGLPEGPRDYRSLALDTIYEVKRSSFPDQQSEGALFLQAAERFILDLSDYPTEEEAIPLAFFVNAQLALVRENITQFLEHIEVQISTNPALSAVKEFRDTMGDSLQAQQKYYDGIFSFWHSHEIFYNALKNVSRRKR